MESGVPDNAADEKMKHTCSTYIMDAHLRDTN